MSKTNDPVVVEMPNTFVSPDGSFAEMELKNSDGSSQILRFSPDTMMIFVNRIFQLFLNQKIQMESKIRYADGPAILVLTTFAQQTIDGKAVILQFRLQNGLPVAFSVSPLEAEKLHRQIGEAVKKTKRQSSENRH